MGKCSQCNFRKNQIAKPCDAGVDKHTDTHAVKREKNKNQTCQAEALD